MKRLKYSDPMLLWLDVDRPSLKSNTMLHLDRKVGQGDEDPLVCGYLKLDGTEDDDDDEEMTQNKLLILVAKDVKTGTYAATCLQEKGVSLLR